MSVRRWTVLAQDPSIAGPDGRPLLAQVHAPAELLSAGPRGHRVEVIDYDAPAGLFYSPRGGTSAQLASDPYAGRKLSRKQIESDPHFHQQNVYAIVMATLGEFEQALGRPLDWAFSSKTQQLKIAPHGIAEPNAYYSREDEALVFGYAPNLSDPQETVYSCLSHDVIAHETTHAIIDGLRPHYMRPSSADQAAFHEGFADLVAILSVFRLSEVVRHLINPNGNRRTVALKTLAPKELRKSVLLKLAEQMGESVWPGRGQALRESANIRPSKTILKREEFQHPHRRGEVLVAAMLNAFLEVWHERIVRLQDVDRSSPESRCNVERVTEEGSKTAGHLLRIAIRALDYSPPVDITFSDYLSAILTSDWELVPDDKYGYREILRRSFGAFGIQPATKSASGRWDGPLHETNHDITHFQQVQREPSEMFKFVWQNAKALEVETSAFTAVEAVKPITRQGPDGITLYETVATYVQLYRVISHELPKRPKGMPGNIPLTLQGGSTLIFNEFGQLKYNIGTSVVPHKQTKRIDFLWKSGYFDVDRRSMKRPFAAIHRNRARGAVDIAKEAW